MAKKENHMGFMSKLLSFGSDKDLKRYYKIVDQINGLEPQFEKMTEEELRGQTDKFRERYANGESLDDMLPEAFATVREASKRTMGMRHFDVQLIGAMALHEGHIAEMKTGEGKTLVSTLAGYLNAIPGHNVHIVTVNDYLARRDSEWMGKVYRFLGLTVGATATAEAFLNFRTLGILVLGVVAFAMGTAGGLLLAKLMNVFSKDGNKINPLIGSAGVSAVPMAARVSQTEGQKENPSNYLLMHAMGPNVAGVVGSAVAAGILLSFLG